MTTMFLSKKVYFNLLFEINVNKYIEKKNGLSDLSWAYAWAEVKKKFPDAEYKVYENLDGNFYHTDGKTCWVKTGVHIEKLEYIEYLPVMDHRNRSISLEDGVHLHEKRILNARNKYSKTEKF